MESTTGELWRLQSGPGAENDDEPRPYLVRCHFTAEDPAQVIDNARAVLTCVVSRLGDWPADELWPQLLPDWFIQRCAPEPPESEHGEPFDVEAWLRQWRAMTPEERVAVEQEPWTLSGWLFYFDPTEEGRGDDRSWWWWHAGTGESVGWVQVATTGWPFGSGSLSWLIEASGGADLVYGP
ncbi:hypothetical protein ABZ368_15595 [Streptomyces sp. NPDC005908]|uniref:hypothetical protein n=1 Tax=unclassified Streptomyces TaxID=2593676 RepID=UPI0011AA678B|nr:hypothetical protein [Streptomyces sp. T12]